MKQNIAQIFVILFLFFRVLAASAAPHCKEAVLENERLMPFRFVQTIGQSISNYGVPELRHQAFYARFDPAAHNPDNLIPIELGDPKIRITVPAHKISFREKNYFMYNVGEKLLLPLNQVYEASIQAHPAFELPDTLGFKVSASAYLGLDIKYILTMREAALNAVVHQLDSAVANRNQNGKYADYNFYRQFQWRANHQYRKNGDNDVFVIFDHEVNRSVLPTVDELTPKVAATIQVSYPTSRQFPQDYLFSDSIGVSKLENLPTVKTWAKGISASDLMRLNALAGNEPVAEIGRYINVNNVPLPVVAKMLLAAFEQIEKRGVHTVFVFGSASNIRAFVRFYRFQKIEDFHYSVYIPELGLPAEQGMAAYHKVGSPAYMAMKEALLKLAEMI